MQAYSIKVLTPSCQPTVAHCPWSSQSHLPLAHQAQLQNTKLICDVPAVTSMFAIPGSMGEYTCCKISVWQVASSVRVICKYATKKKIHTQKKEEVWRQQDVSFFFLINGDCSSNPDCMRRMNTQSTAAALQATLSFVLTIQMSSRAWRTLQKQRRARGAWLQSGSPFFFIYRGFPWLCFPVMMLCQLLFMILSQLSARCELQRSYDFRALTGSKSSPSDSLRAFGRAGW